MLGAFAACSALNSKLLKALKTMCLSNSDGNASFLQFLSSVVGLFHSHLVYHHIKDPGGYRVGEAKRGGKKTPAHVFEGVEAKRKLEPVSARAQAAQRPFPVLLETFGYLH